MKSKEEIWDKHFEDWIIAGQIKRNALPAMDEYAKEVAIDYLKWFLIKYQTDEGRYPTSSIFGNTTIFLGQDEVLIGDTFNKFLSEQSK